MKEAISAFANDLPGSGAPGIVFVGGAIGSHANAVREARVDFAELASSILQRVAGAEV